MNSPQVVVSRDDILELQSHLMQYDQIDCPLEHFFAPGVYGRQIFMPAGAVVVGKIHKHAHLNNISQGRCIVATEFGKMEIVAPFQFISQPGTKRAVYVVEDTIWTTYHPHDLGDVSEDDLERIEDHVIAKSFDDYDEYALGVELVKQLEVFS